MPPSSTRPEFRATAPAKRSRWLPRALLAAGVALLAGVLSTFDWPGVLQVLAAADPAWLGALSGLALVYVGLRSLRWWMLLRARDPRVAFWPLHVANAVGVGLGNVTPAQGGELIKVELAARATGRSRAELASVFVLERLLDLAALGAVFLAGSRTIARGIPIDWLAVALVAGPALALVAGAALIWRRATRAVLEVVGSYVARARLMAAVVVTTLFSWAVVVAMWIAVARLLRIELDWAQAMALVGGVTVLRVATLVPGGVGVDEAGVVGLMVLMGYAETEAAAYALAGRLTDVALLLLAAVFWLARDREGRAGARAGRCGPAASPASGGGRHCGARSARLRREKIDKMKTLSSYVLGAFREGEGGFRTLYDPTSEEPLARCSSAGVDFAAVVAFAREKGLAALRGMGFAERGGLLERAAKAFHEHRDELIELSIRNGGNTRKDAKFDIDGATGTLTYYAALGKELGGGNVLADGEGVQLGRSPRFFGRHLRVPRAGVAVHINAFNFPAWGMGEKMACAILAGVPVIEKPGTPSALLAWRMAEILVEREILPEGAFQMVVGQAGDLLTHLGAQDHVAFTGSARTALGIRTKTELVERGVRVNVEADSINAAVFGPDVAPGSETFDLAIANVVVDMTQKAGQKCTAVRRILVPEALAEDIVNALVERLDAVVVGDPAEEATGMGPLASADQLEDVRRGIAELQAAARIVRGGPEPLREKGYFVAPTLLVAADPRASVLHEREVFGPVATVVPYSGVAAEAAYLTNLDGGGLVASVYSDDPGWTEEVVLAVAPWHGRVWIGSEKTAAQALPPGAVLPQTIHGGPGRAGGGEELGGLRGLEFYTQRTALQGYKGFVARAFGGTE